MHSWWGVWQIWESFWRQDHNTTAGGFPIHPSNRMSHLNLTSWSWTELVPVSAARPQGALKSLLYHSSKSSASPGTLKLVVYGLIDLAICGAVRMAARARYMA